MLKSTHQPLINPIGALEGVADLTQPHTQEKFRISALLHYRVKLNI